MNNSWVRTSVSHSGKFLPMSGTSSYPCVRSSSAESNSLIPTKLGKSESSQDPGPSPGWGKRWAWTPFQSEKRKQIGRRCTVGGEAKRQQQGKVADCILKSTWISQFDATPAAQNFLEGICTRRSAVLGRDGKYLREVNTSRFLPPPAGHSCSKWGTTRPLFPPSPLCRHHPLPAAGSHWSLVLAPALSRPFY